MNYLGDFKASSSVNFNFTTNSAAGAAVAPLSAFESADLIIYKDNSATQRTSSAGVTMTSPFDSITGLHHVTIDLSDNTDSGFYAAGHDYYVVLSPDTETVDGQTVVKEVANFSIENRCVNWAKVASPTTTVGLSGTTVGTLTTNSDKTGYSLSASQTFSTTGSVASVGFVSMLGDLVRDTATIVDVTIISPTTEAAFDVSDGTKFAANDIIGMVGSKELMKVTAVVVNTITVTRGWASTTAEAITDGMTILITRSSTAVTPLDATQTQAAANAAIVANRLNYLLLDAIPVLWTTTVNTNTVMDYITSKDGTRTWVRSTESLQAIGEGVSAIQTALIGIGTAPTAAQNADELLNRATSTLTDQTKFGGWLVSGVYSYLTRTQFNTLLMIEMMEATTPDDSASNVPGILRGTAPPLLLPYPFFTRREAMHFYNNDTYIYGGYAGGVNCGVVGLSTSDGSFRVTCKISRFRAGVAEAIAGKFGGTDPARNWLLFIDANGKLNFNVYNSAAVAVTAVGTTTLAVSTEYIVEGNWTGTALNVKVNGVAEGTTPAVSALQAPNATTPMWIGRDDSDSAPLGFYGLIGDVEVQRGATVARSYDLAIVESESFTAPTVVEIRTELDANSTKLIGIDAKTTNLPSDPADASDIASAFSTVNATLGLIAGYIDTEVAAIKAKTDNLPSDPADESLIIAATDAIMTRIGAAGAGLTALGDTRIANLDAAVSSRMATYAQPTGFLAATFPALIASTTNITAGTMTTTTNLTNLPSIPAGWLTAAGIAVDAIDADALATDAVSEIAAKITADHGSGSYVDTGGGGLDAAGVRSAIGLATANLDTQLASSATAVAAVKTDTGNLVTRITSTLFAGVTSLGKWLGLLAGKTADAGTLAEVNATTAGATYDNTTDSQEAIRDRGDAAWTGGGGLDAQGVADAGLLAPSGAAEDGSLIDKLDTIISMATTDNQVDGLTDEAKQDVRDALAGFAPTIPVVDDSIDDKIDNATPDVDCPTLGDISGVIIGLLAGMTVTVTSPFNPDDRTLTLTRGDSYDGTAWPPVNITVTGSQLPNDLGSDSVVLLRIMDRFDPATLAVEVEGEIVLGVGATKSFNFELTAAQTGALEPGTGVYQADVVVLIGDDSDHVATPVQMSVIVLRNAQAETT